MWEDGYSREDCLRFDLMCVGFVNAWERERDATVWVPEKKEDLATRRAKAKLVEKPKRAVSWLLERLGLDPTRVTQTDPTPDLRRKSEEPLPVDPAKFAELWGDAESEEPDG